MQIGLDSFAYSLARISWDVFGTLTFRSVPSTTRAFGQVWRHLRYAAELSEQRYSRLLVALRPELGELGGRFHFHYLLGGTQTRNVITLANQLNYHWRGKAGGHSIAEIRTYDPTLAGVEYVTKCLSEGTTGKNEYELRKFNLSENVELSQSVFRVIRGLDRYEDRTQRRARAKRRSPDEGLIGGGMYCAND